MYDEVRVVPEVLESLSRTVDDIAAALARDAADASPETQYAARELNRWLTGRSIEELGGRWNDDFERLAKQLAGMSEGLLGCARDYRHADQANADNFRTSTGW